MPIDVVNMVEKQIPEKNSLSRCEPPGYQVGHIPTSPKVFASSVEHDQLWRPGASHLEHLFSGICFRGTFFKFNVALHPEKWQ